MQKRMILDKINNIALYNPERMFSPLCTISLIQNTVRWRSDWLDGAVVPYCLGTPGQTKVSGDRQRETTHEICCLAAK